MSLERHSARLRLNTRMISTGRTGFAVFAVGALLGMGGCGDQDSGTDGGAGGSSCYGSGGQTSTREETESSEVSQQCQDEGMTALPYAVQGPGPEPDTVRMVYASGGSITPCAARLEGDTLVLLVLDPQISTMDLRPHCAQVNLSAAGIDSVEDGTSVEDLPEQDRRNLENSLGGECEPVPIID